MSNITHIATHKDYNPKLSNLVTQKARDSRAIVERLLRNPDFVKDVLGRDRGTGPEAA